MARRKTLPESVRVKQSLSERLAALRAELFGDRGGPELARRLGVPIRTWYNYEAGVTVPAEVILKIIEITSVQPMWLLHGRGPKFMRSAQDAVPESILLPGTSVEALILSALDLIEQEDAARVPGAISRERGPDESLEAGWAGSRQNEQSRPGRPRGDQRTESGQRRDNARDEWLEAQRENRCVRVAGNAMAPILADGAVVAFARAEEDPAELDGKLVVGFIEGSTVVRWFKHHGRFAVLRAANPSKEAPEIVVDLQERSNQRWFRRVERINTPH